MEICLMIQKEEDKAVAEPDVDESGEVELTRYCDTGSIHEFNKK